MIRYKKTLAFVLAVALFDAAATVSLFIPLGLEGNPIAALLATGLGFAGYLGVRVGLVLCAWVVAEAAEQGGFTPPLAFLFLAHVCLAVYLAACTVTILGFV